jgi:glutathione synthase/RimK-type ligase-like ATP-grasp enzyme
LILVVSHDRDEHARAVLAALKRRGAPARLLDLARFPRHLTITLSHGDGAGGPVLATPHGRPLRLDDVGAIWWRRPQPFVLHDELRGLARRAFAWREGREAFQGMWQSLRCRWVNHPLHDEAANHKPFQLATAARLGLAVPRTCITSDPGRARADWRETRIVGPRELRRLERARFAPIIFQEYVPGEDVRVTAVGGRLFAAAIDARDTGHPFDFRPVLDQARVEPTVLPGPLAGRLRRLVDELGLAYAAIDLRRSESGRWFFLEANPSGQWIFVEKRTGQPITEAVAALLAGT